MGDRIQGPPPPPRERALQELPPVIEPRLRDMPPYPGPGVEGGFEVVRSEPLDGQELDALARRALEIAETDDRVRQRLADHRFAGLGASVSSRDKERGRTDTVLVLFYDYDSNVTVEVELAGEAEELTVVRVEDADYQPAPSDDEIERAIALARADRRVAARVTDDLTPRTILVSAVEQGDRHHGTRRLEVAFGRPTERLPRLRTLVDLGAEKVLGVGIDIGHESEDAEGFADAVSAEEDDR